MKNWNFLVRRGWEGLGPRLHVCVPQCLSLGYALP